MNVDIVDTIIGSGVGGVITWLGTIKFSPHIRASDVKTKDA